MFHTFNFHNYNTLTFLLLDCTVLQTLCTQVKMKILDNLLQKYNLCKQGVVTKIYIIQYLQSNNYLLWFKGPILFLLLFYMFFVLKSLPKYNDCNIFIWDQNRKMIEKQQKVHKMVSHYIIGKIDQHQIAHILI